MASISDILVRLMGEDVSAGRTMDEVGAQLAGFGAMDVEAELGLNDASVKTKLDEVQARLARFAADSAEAKIGLSSTEFYAEVDHAREVLSSIDRDKATPELLLAIAKFEATLHAAEGQMDEFTRNRSIEVKVDMDRSTVSQFAAMAGYAKTAASEVENLGQKTEQAGASASGAGGGFGSLASQIPIVGGMSAEAGGAIAGVLIPSVVSLLGFLAALVASAAAAGAGLGALGLTAVAAFGPVGALAAVAFYQISQATQASQAYASAQQAVKSASDSLTNAEQSLTSAQTQRHQAVDALAQAEKDAAQQIRGDQMQATDQLTAAEVGLTNANYQAKQSEDQLTLARQAARRALVDEQLAAEGATLGHADAVISLAQARRNLDALLAQQGTPGGPSGLDIRAARQQVRDAEFQVDQARVASGRAQRDLNAAEQQGVNQNPGVVAARHQVKTADQGVTDATTKLHEAEAAYRKAEAETVQQAPQVVSARQQVASATTQVANAQRAVNVATEKLGYAQEKAQKAYTKMADTRGAQAVVRIFRHVLESLQAATEPIFRGIAKGLRALMPLLNQIGPQLTRLGKVMGQAFVQLLREFAKPAWQRFFKELLRNSADLARIGTRGFILLLRTLRNIVDAGLPFLVRGMRDLNHWLAGVAKGSKGVDLGPVVHALTLWLKLSYQLGRVFLAFVQDASGAGNGLVRVITRGLKAWADWLNSASGKNRVAQFFRDTLPLAKDLFSLFGQLLLAVIQLGEFAAPVLDPLVRALTGIAHWLNVLLDLFNKIPAPIRGAFGEIIASGGPVNALLHHLLSSTHILSSAWHAIRDAAKRVWGAIGDAIKAGPKAAYDWLVHHNLTSVMQARWGDIKDLAGRVWGKVGGAITAPVSDAYGWLKGHIAPSWIASSWGSIRNAAKTIWGGIARGISGAIRGAYTYLRDASHVLGNVFHKVFSGIADIVQGALGAVHKAIHGIVTAINFIVGKLGDLKDKLSGAIPSLPGGISIPGIGGLPGVPSPGDAIGAVGGLFNYRGGVVNRPGYFAGEEAPQHPEVIVATNPRYRDRNVGLWQKAGQMLGIPGFKKGGVRYALPWPGGTSQFGELDMGIDVGGTGPVMAMDSGTVTKPNYNPFSSSGYGSPTSGLVYRMDHPPRGYSPSSPYVYIYELFNPRSSASGRINAGQILGNIMGGTGIEMGWATSSGTPLAQALGEDVANRHSYPRGLPTSISLQNFIRDIQGGKHIAAGAGGVGGLAQAILLPKIPVEGKGPLAAITGAAIEKMRSVANAYLSKIEPKTPGFKSAPGGAPGSVGYVPPGGGSVVEQVWRILKSYGFKATAAAGILGNAYRESLPPWNPASVGTGGGGLWGFTTGAVSLAALQAYAQAHNKPWTDVGIQTEFMLQNGGLALKGALNNERSAAGAARLFEQDWENAGVVAMGDRIHGAKLALQIIKHMKGARTGGSIAGGVLGAIGAEMGIGELVAMPDGTEVIPGQLTSRLTSALMGHPAQVTPGTGGNGAGPGDLKVVINGDVVSKHPEPVQIFRGDRKVGQWVRDVAAQESDGDRRHTLRLERMKRP